MALIVSPTGQLLLLVKPKRGARAVLSTPTGEHFTLDLRPIKGPRGHDEVSLPTNTTGVYRVVVRRRRAGRVRAHIEDRATATPRVLQSVEARTQWTIVYEVVP
jgi:hypothetical protein